MTTTAQERRELETNTDRLLALLSDGRWHHMTELHDAAGWRFGGRLHDLRKKRGVQVEKRRIGSREWEYRMLPQVTLF